MTLQSTRWRRWILCAILSPIICIGAAFAADQSQSNWPQWRGPLATGVAPAADPPITWRESQNVKWKVPISGSGTSTPIVWDNMIFIQTAVNTGRKAAAAPAPAPSTVLAAEPAPGQRRQRGPGGRRGAQSPTDVYQFLLLCIDRQTGNTIWQKTVREEVPHEGHHPDHGFASFSPVTDGKHVYSYFGSRGLHCYDMQGNLKWQKDFGDLQTKMGFGEGGAPALHGDTIVINWDHEGSDFIVALNAITGDEKWRQPRDEDTTWATPLIVQVGDRTEVITTATRKIRSYDLATGKQIWECGGMTSNVIPTPVTDGTNVYITSGFRGAALLAIKLGRQGDLTNSDAIVWKHNKATPYVPSPLLYGDRIYFFSGNNGVLSAFDTKTGRPVIDTQRLSDIEGVYASPVGASDKIFLLGRNGAAVVIKRSDKLEVLATNHLDDRFEASPAIVGKEIFLRGQKNLYCIAEK